MSFRSGHHGFMGRGYSIRQGSGYWKAENDKLSVVDLFTIRAVV